MDFDACPSSANCGAYDSHGIPDVIRHVGRTFSHALLSEGTCPPPRHHLYPTGGPIRPFFLKKMNRAVGESSVQAGIHILKTTTVHHALFESKKRAKTL